MTAEQAAMMLQLQQVGMTMDDLREYLDTHLYDTYAIEPIHHSPGGIRIIVPLNGPGGSAISPGIIKEDKLCGFMKKNCNIQ